MAKWYTCAPESFNGDETFFWRDSGLICRGLQQLGHESKVVMHLPAREDDLPDIIRIDPKEMSDPEWWRSQKLDGVIFVAWGRHRDTPYIRAIAESGTPVIAHLDGAGLHFPLFNRREIIHTFWRSERDIPQSVLAKVFSFLKKVFLGGLKVLLKHSYLKYRHLSYATAVTCQSPSALQGNLRLFRLFGGENHGVRIKQVGCPIPAAHRWDPAVPKKKKILAVGRWYDLVYKRPYLLMAVCEQIVRRQPDLEFDIIGTRTEVMEKWHQNLPADVRSRINMPGICPGDAVARAMQEAQIMFCPSSSESGPLILFEGLNCGMTAVAFDSCCLPGFRWAAENHHADLVTSDTPEAYVAALETALEKWERGVYSPREISEFWIPRTRVDIVVQKMLDAATEDAPV